MILAAAHAARRIPAPAPLAIVGRYIPNSPTNVIDAGLSPRSVSRAGSARCGRGISATHRCLRTTVPDLAAYTTVDGQIGFRSPGHWLVALEVFNIADVKWNDIEYYYVSRLQNEASPQPTTWFTPVFRGLFAPAFNTNFECATNANEQFALLRAYEAPFKIARSRQYIHGRSFCALQGWHPPERLPDHLFQSKRIVSAGTSSMATPRVADWVPERGQPFGAPVVCRRIRLLFPLRGRQRVNAFS